MKFNLKRMQHNQKKKKSKARKTETVYNSIVSGTDCRKGIDEEACKRADANINRTRKARENDDLQNDTGRSNILKKVQRKKDMRTCQNV